MLLRLLLFFGCLLSCKSLLVSFAWLSYGWHCWTELNRVAIAVLFRAVMTDAAAYSELGHQRNNNNHWQGISAPDAAATALSRQQVRRPSAEAPFQTNSIRRCRQLLRRNQATRNWISNRHIQERSSLHSYVPPCWLAIGQGVHRWWSSWCVDVFVWKLTEWLLYINVVSKVALFSLQYCLFFSVWYMLRRFNDVCTDYCIFCCWCSWCYSPKLVMIILWKVTVQSTLGAPWLLLTHSFCSWSRRSEVSEKYDGSVVYVRSTNETQHYHRYVPLAPSWSFSTLLML